MTGHRLLAGIALLHLPPLTLIGTGTRTRDWDPIYYLLKVLAWFGIVWDLHEVPEEVRHAR